MANKIANALIERGVEPRNNILVIIPDELENYTKWRFKNIYIPRQ